MIFQIKTYFQLNATKSIFPLDFFSNSNWTIFMKAIYLVSILFFSFHFNVFASSQKNITFLIAEREYNTKETLPKFTKQHLSKNFSIEFCNAPNEGEKRNQLSNSSAIREADLLFISVRRRAFKEETMKLIRLHILKANQS